MLKRSSAQGDLNGFLDAGSHIQGELQFEDTFRIDGKLTGKIVSNGELVVGERGEVDGEVDVRCVYVSGTVRGTLRARERLEITASGRVHADLLVPTLTIEDGAFFEGSCKMARGGEGSKDAQDKDTRRNVTRMPVAGSQS
ncbi:MAG: polymer-forming cytoskeletal protein [Acidobacteriota bacterium]